jgi:hypothetical protein
MIQSVIGLVPTTRRVSMISAAAKAAELGADKIASMDGS